MASFIEKAFPTIAGRGKKDTAGTGQPAPRKHKPVKAALPQVDLLPPNLVLQVRRRQIRFGFLVAGIVIVVLLALAYVFQTTRAGVATAALTLTQQQVMSAERQLEQYSPIVTYLDEAQKREELAATIISDEVDYRQTLATLEAGLPSGSYQSVSITPNLSSPEDSAAQTAFVDACGPKTDPFAAEAPPTVACVNIAGKAPDRAAIANLTNTLRSTPGYSNVYLLASAGAPDGVPFQGSYTILRTEEGAPQ